VYDDKRELAGSPTPRGNGTLLVLVEAVKDGQRRAA